MRSLRLQLLALLLGLTLTSTTILGWLAYRDASQAVVRGALEAVGVAAQAREQGLFMLLSRRRERASSFLQAAHADCALAPQTEECISSLVDFMMTEHAVGGYLDRGKGEPLLVGPEAAALKTALLPAAHELARFQPRTGEGRRFVVVAREEGLVLRLLFDTEQLDQVFLDNTGLGASGESFLVDRDGIFITPPRYSPPDGLEAPVHGRPMEKCLASQAGEVVAPDYRGVLVIHGFRRARGIGGGCIMAHFDEAEAFAPVRSLRTNMLVTAIAFAAFALTLSLLFVRSVLRPLARLGSRAHAFAQEDFTSPVPIEGPDEVRSLGRAFQAMAASLDDSKRRIERALDAERGARSEAERLDRMKDEFLATMSHELRTPLNAILGWATLLRDRAYEPSSFDRAVRTIERNAKAQARLIEDILDVSRIITGKLRVEPRDVEVAQFVRPAVDAVRPAADAKGVTLSVAGEVDAIVYGDADRLQQVAWNLVSNAVKFTAQGGTVDVEIARTPTGVDIVVRDSGIGVAEADLPRIFERFRQVDSSTTRAHGGLGLGLAIVRHLVELHGGTVTATSGGPGKGTTFIVSLPERPASVLGEARAPAEEPVASATPVSLTRARLDDVDVLVVEDDDATREVVQTALEDAGAHVRSVPSASAALEAFDVQPPDVLVSDIGMPGTDGFGLIRSVRAREESSGGAVPAIALTAYSRARDVEEAYAAGYQKHLAKPIEVELLLRAVAQLAGTWTPSGGVAAAKPAAP